MKKNRNRILFFAALLFVAANGLVSCNSAPKKVKENTKETSADEKFIGLQLYSVREDMKDVAGTLAAVGDMGYKFVETAGYSNGKMYGMDPVEFKNLCETNGLQFLGAHAGQAIPDPEKMDEIMAWWDECIAAHQAAEVKWIVQPFMGKTGYESLEGLKRYCEYFNAVGQKCNDAGIRFGYHNHAQEFTTVLEGKPVYDWMLELTDPDKVMFELDLYWITEGGKQPVEYFDKYPGRFELWHIKDQAELGASGNIDYKTIFSDWEKSGAKYGVVEIEEYNFPPLESAKKSLQFLLDADYVNLSE